MQMKGKVQQQRKYRFSYQDQKNDCLMKPFSKFQDLRSKIKNSEVQAINSIKQGYLTPNNFKIKFMCKNHKYTKSSHFIQISESQRVYLCQECSTSASLKDFSVKKLNQIKNLLELTKQNKVQSKKMNFQKNQKFNELLKKQSLLEKTCTFIQSTDTLLKCLDKQADQQIDQIDIIGKQILKELNDRFNQVMRFLNWQKQGCIQLILEKIDRLKDSMQSLKKNINNERWCLDTIQSKLNLLNSQNFQSNDQFINSMIKTYQSKVEQSSQKRNAFNCFFLSSRQLNKKFSEQQLGSVQNIVETVYKNFFSAKSLKRQNRKNQHQQNKNKQNQHQQNLKRDFKNYPSLDRQSYFLKSLYNQNRKKNIPDKQEAYFTTVEQFPSSIKKQPNSALRSNKSLQEQIKSLEQTNNKNGQKQGCLIEVLNKRNLNPTISQFNYSIKKRPSQTTIFSSCANLRS